MKAFLAFFINNLLCAMFMALPGYSGHHDHIRQILAPISVEQWGDINNRLVSEQLLNKGAHALDQITEDLRWLEDHGFRNADICGLLDCVVNAIDTVPHDDNDLSVTGYERSIHIYIDSQLFQVEIKFLPGIDYSPFDVEFETCVFRYSIKNLANHKTVHLLGTSHDMMKKYAFYGGVGSWHRVSPLDLAMLLGIEARQEK